MTDTVLSLSANATSLVMLYIDPEMGPGLTTASEQRTQVFLRSASLTSLSGALYGCGSHLASVGDTHLKREPTRRKVDLRAGGRAGVNRPKSSVRPETIILFCLESGFNNL